MKSLQSYITENKSEYTIHGEFSEYSDSKNGEVPCVDSEKNIFPSITALARYHNVSPGVLNNASGIFKSKTLNKKISAEFISKEIINPKEFDLFDGNHMDELSKKLKIYDELFNDYRFKGIKATICSNGWAGPDKISTLSFSKKYNMWVPDKE